MSHRERTIQQLDPLGALGARLFTIAAIAGMVAYAHAMTWLNRFDIVMPSIAVLALLAITGAAVIVVAGTSPARAPVRRPTFVLALGLAFSAMVLNAVAMWGANQYVQDDWGHVAIGMLLVAFSPYRMSRELALSGLLAAIFTGFLVLLQAPALVSSIPTFVFVIVAMAPILAMSFGSAALASTIIASIRRWRSRATLASEALVSQLHDGIARSVQQDRVTILNRDVVPFFSDVLHRAELSDDDREEARQIAESIRRVMVAEVDRSWLDGVVEQVGASLGHMAPGAEAVQDNDRLAAAMTTDQRTATRALLVALFGHPEFDPDGFDVRIARRSGGNQVTVRAMFAAPETSVRSDLAPYFAVLRVVFTNLRVAFARNTLTLKFSYDER